MLNTFKSKPKAGYKWYVVYTQSRAEKKAAQYLQDVDIQHFLPLIKTIRQWSDRKKKVEVPLFPSYMFVYVSLNEYYKVLEIPYISRYLFFDGKPASISQKEIDKIKKLINADVEMEVISEKILQGQQIEITHGLLRGIKGEMISYKGTNMVAIKIQQIEFAMLIHVAVNHLKILNEK